MVKKNLDKAGKIAYNYIIIRGVLLYIYNTLYDLEAILTASFYFASVRTNNWNNNNYKDPLNS